MHYKNFKTAVYLPTWVSQHLDEKKLSSDYDFIEKYIGLDKVYLETHREQDIPKEQLVMIKEFLESKGVEVAGGITTVIRDFDGAEKGKRRIFNTFCFSDPAMRERLKEIVEFTAGIFDEIILDDFYFTNCKCERCIKEKGDRDWVTFRRDLLLDVSKNLVVGPAKKINPNVKMVIKYPNWREGYHFTGYRPEEEKEIFDATYIGTETRSPRYTDQHLPEYLSYSLVRYMENAWPDRNGGGWFDTFSCFSADRYLEQCYLTAFAKAKELAFFYWGDIVDNYFAGPVGIQLKKIDKMMDGIGNPVGVPTYIPYNSSGENHVEMRLGMLGIPIETSPEFPSGDKTILLTESSADDKDVISKLKSFVVSGGDAVITSGFLKRKGNELREEGLTEAVVTDRNISVTRYQMTSDEAGYIDNEKPIIFPEILHGNNDSWSYINGGDGDYHTPLFLMSTYGKGRIFTLSIPDNYADLYKIPNEVIDTVKKIFDKDFYVSGKGISTFTYDDGSFILYKYVKDEMRNTKVKIFTKKNATKLIEEVRGWDYPVMEYTYWEEWEDHTYKYVEVSLEPGRLYKFKWEE